MWLNIFSQKSMICLRHFALKWRKKEILVIMFLNTCIAISAMIGNKRYWIVLSAGLKNFPMLIMS